MNAKVLWLMTGWLSLFLGALGVFLPLLPTTPFVLLAAWCFARGSERWHTWLLSRPYFGPLIRDWNERGAIRPRAKWMATVLMIPLFSLAIFLSNLLWALKVGLACIGLSVLTFIWTRPEK